QGEVADLVDELRQLEPGVADLEGAGRTSRGELAVELGRRLAVDDLVAKPDPTVPGPGGPVPERPTGGGHVVGEEADLEVAVLRLVVIGGSILVLQLRFQLLVLVLLAELEV